MTLFERMRRLAETRPIYAARLRLAADDLETAERVFLRDGGLKAAMEVTRAWKAARALWVEATGAEP